MNLKQKLSLNLKNLIGWRTNRKIIVFSVDDYGNVRLDSKKARQNLDHAGIKARSRFDAYDTLENSSDLESLYEILSSVKDKNGRHAIFTPFALPCNINFEKMAENGYKEYEYEQLPETYQKLSVLQPEAYSGTWKLWKEGIEKGLMVPQFHGREHLNLKVFEKKLEQQDVEVVENLKNRSYTGISDSGYDTISPYAAFDFWDFTENYKFEEIILDGLDAFEKVYGYRSVHFNPPGGREHPVIHEALEKGEIKYLDTPLLKPEHQGNGKYKKKFNYTGKQNRLNQTFLVRNVVFEPTDARNVEWVSYVIDQIEAAFRWNRPAIISSHRVNFCGHIDEGNREKGIDALKKLLQQIVRRWPEVEFMAANELGDLISSNIKKR